MMNADKFHGNAKKNALHMFSLLQAIENVTNEVIDAGYC